MRKFLYIPKATSAPPRAGTTGMIYIYYLIVLWYIYIYYIIYIFILSFMFPIKNCNNYQSQTGFQALVLRCTISTQTDCTDPKSIVPTDTRMKVVLTLLALNCYNVCICMCIYIYMDSYVYICCHLLIFAVLISKRWIDGWIDGWTNS